MGIGLFGRESEGEEADDCRVYDERKPPEPSYPSITPSIADFVLEPNVKDNIVNGDEEELRFAPPG